MTIPNIPFDPVQRREIKHHVYGKNELQKYHAIMIFPLLAFFPSCFAIFNVRPIFVLVNDVSTLFKVLLQLTACVQAQWWLFIIMSKKAVNYQLLEN